MSEAVQGPAVVCQFVSRLDRFCNQRGANEGSQVGFERVGDLLRVDFVAIDMERKGSEVFLFLGGILDRRLGPSIKGKLFCAMLLRLGNIRREGVGPDISLPRPCRARMSVSG